tara:strand:+ start:571 stop:1053 length:483 start_codon:yes stop_codon:yes gene_type:complete
MTKLKEKEIRDETIDLAEKLILENGEPLEVPITHRFTEGLYIREIFVSAGTLFTTETHKKQNPFVISLGKYKVYDGENILVIEAPHTGITEPNTRRLVYAEEDTIWTTFHVTDKTDIEEIEKEIFIDHKNKYVDPDLLEQHKNIVRSIDIYPDNKKIGGK